jgi:hypothetical protein
MNDRLEGGCSCGAVRYLVEGRPTRVGICHCTYCRHETGSVFMAFAVYPSDKFSFTGDTSHFHNRHFCVVCGSRLFTFEAGAPEMEIKIGTLDRAPSDLTVSYEIWVKRREAWLAPIQGAEQFEEDRTR